MECEPLWKSVVVDAASEDDGDCDAGVCDDGRDGWDKPLRF